MTGLVHYQTDATSSPQNRTPVSPTTPLPVTIAASATGTGGVASAAPADMWEYAAASGGITDTADNTVKAAVAATRHYVTSIQLANTSATATEVILKDGATVKWRGYATASTGNSPPVVFATPIRWSANSAVVVAMGTTASATRVNVQGYSSTV